MTTDTSNRRDRRGRRVEWYLSNEKGGGVVRSPVGWWSPVPVYIDGCPCRDPHIIVLDYTRRIDQIQSTMDKSGFGLQCWHTTVLGATGQIHL